VPVKNSWVAICWSPQRRLFVAVGFGGTSSRMLTSPDVITWTTRQSPASHIWRGVCWAAELGLFVAVATISNSTNQSVMTSSYGISWTLPSTPADNTWRSICWWQWAKAAPATGC
jgi:hypothetical protein